MHVVATAGHVDHGKSTLAKCLTGMQPDRWAEERNRGLTIDLGFVWTELAGSRMAFVDVPGHERFVPNMLAGIGPVGAVLFVVAADEGWMAQSEEHLAALDAFGVRHGLLAITKSDRADPAPVLRDAGERIAATTLGDVPAVAVSGYSGAGMGRLADELVGLSRRLPEPDRSADVRLWIDRAFTVRGAGTVVTGTLAGGTIRVGNELVHSATQRPVTVRGLQELGQERAEVSAVSRVAINLRGVHRGELERGDALLTPHRWRRTDEFDAAVRGCDATTLPAQLMLHLGSASPAVRVRPLGGHAVRLRLDTGLPLRVGDVGLLRDPGQHQVAAGVRVLDVDPPGLRRRGAARARTHELSGDPHAAFLRRNGFLRAADLRAMGLAPAGTRVGTWVVDDELLAGLPERAAAAFEAWIREHPIAAGMPVEQLRTKLDLPDVELLHAALAGTELVAHQGRVRRPGAAAELPRHVERAVGELDRGFAAAPFRAPAADELTRLGLGTAERAAAVRAGRLTPIADGVVLGPDALARAQAELAALASPFTMSEARRLLDTTRRVAVPLLEHLDAAGVTERLDDDRRRLRG